jgi:hypothetical protein
VEGFASIVEGFASIVEGFASIVGVSCIILSFAHPSTCVPWL